MTGATALRTTVVVLAVIGVLLALVWSLQASGGSPAARSSSRRRRDSIGEPEYRFARARTSVTRGLPIARGWWNRCRLAGRSTATRSSLRARSNAVRVGPVTRVAPAVVSPAARAAPVDVTL